jgi:hypothetical protein
LSAFCNSGDDLYGTVQKNNLIYVHLHTVNDTLKLPPLSKKIITCKEMNGASLKFIQNKKGITVFLNNFKPDSNVSTLVLEMK